MIKQKRDRSGGKIEIDLTGPQGNAFVVMGVGQSLAKQLGKDFEPIRKEMMSGDYENLLAVMEREFGDFIIMYR